MWLGNEKVKGHVINKHHNGGSICKMCTWQAASCWVTLIGRVWELIYTQLPKMAKTELKFVKIGNLGDKRDSNIYIFFFPILCVVLENRRIIIGFEHAENTRWFESYHWHFLSVWSKFQAVNTTFTACKTFGIMEKSSVKKRKSQSQGINDAH